MRWLGRGRGHDRWAGSIAAYVDGELPGRESSRLDAHLSGCPVCIESVAQERALKRLLGRSLAEVRVPRSFAITEAMLARRDRPTRNAVGVPLLAMRLAQGVAVAAVIGFASLVVLDRGKSGSDSAPAAAAFTSTESERAGATAGNLAPEAGSARDAGSSKSGATAVPPYSPGGVQGQSAVSPAPSAPPAAADSAGNVVEPSETIRDAPDLEAAPLASPDEKSGTDWPGVARAALVLVSIAALGGYFVARRANGRSIDV